MQMNEKEYLLKEKASGTLCDEGHRILFVINQRGLDLALEWAIQTKWIYKRALLDKTHHASLRHYKRTFIESYLALKGFINYGN